MDNPEQAREWDLLHDRIDDLFRRHGASQINGHGNIPGELADYHLEKRNSDLYRQKVTVHKPEWVRPEIIKSLQNLLIEYPKWEIIILLEIVGGRVVIRDDEVLDGLRRDRLPDRCRPMVYDGSRILGSRFGDIMYSGLTVAVRPGPVNIRIADDFDFTKLETLPLHREPGKDGESSNKQTVKTAYFDVFKGPGWPSQSQLEHYFLTPWGQRWVRHTHNDCWGLSAEGVEGTEHLPRGEGRIDLGLTMVGNPDHGVLLHYWKVGGSYKDSFYSKRDLTRLREWVETAHGDLFPIGLYIPFETAWMAVKEFIETDGRLPKSIEWVAGDDLPADAFPDP